MRHKAILWWEPRMNRDSSAAGAKIPSFRGASDAEQSTQLCKACKAEEDGPCDQVFKGNYNHLARIPGGLPKGDICPYFLPGRIWHKVIFLWKLHTNRNSCLAGEKIILPRRHSSLGVLQEPSNELSPASR